MCHGVRRPPRARDLSPARSMGRERPFRWRGLCGGAAKPGNNHDAAQVVAPLRPRLIHLVPTARMGMAWHVYLTLASMNRLRVGYYIEMSD